MLEVGRGTDVSQEALGAEDCGKVGTQDLEGDEAVVSEVAGAR